MMKRIIFSLLLLTSTLAYTRAQNATQTPDLQTTDNAIFDPTRTTPTVKEEYHFAVDYRFEIGYAQINQRTPNLSFPDLYLHGIRTGLSVDFHLPIHFSLQTGLLFHLAFGSNQQHWRSMNAASSMEEYQQHRVLEWTATIPVHCYYTIPVWKQLNMFFFTGLEMSIGLIEHDFVLNHLSSGTENWINQVIGYPIHEYDRYTNNELHRLNTQWVLGGGLEWEQYRVQAGYDFGLNNMVRTPTCSKQHVWEWGWYISFLYKF